MGDVAPPLYVGEGLGDVVVAEFVDRYKHRIGCRADHVGDRLVAGVGFLDEPIVSGGAARGVITRGAAAESTLQATQTDITAAATTQTWCTHII